MNTYGLLRETDLERVKDVEDEMESHRKDIDFIKQYLNDDGNKLEDLI